MSEIRPPLNQLPLESEGDPSVGEVDRVAALDKAVVAGDLALMLPLRTGGAQDEHHVEVARSGGRMVVVDPEGAPRGDGASRVLEGLGTGGVVDVAGPASWAIVERLDVGFLVSGVLFHLGAM